MAAGAGEQGRVYKGTLDLGNAREISCRCFLTEHSVQTDCVL